MTDEPRRWLDSEISPELRELLRSAEGDAALPGQVAGLHAKLERALGPSFGGVAEAGLEAQAESAASNSPAAAGGGAAIGGALALATVLMLGLGALWYGTRTSEPPPVAVQQIAAAAPQAQPQPQPQIAPHASVAPAEAELESQPSAAAPKPLQPSARLPQKVAQGGGLLEELRQLEAIRRQLPDQPARALGAIAQHARRFPQGALGPERELLRIEALQRAGRAEDARRAAEQALALERQPYAVQIRQLMAAGARQP